MDWSGLGEEGARVGVREEGVGEGEEGEGTGDDVGKAPFGISGELVSA